MPVKSRNVKRGAASKKATSVTSAAIPSSPTAATKSQSTSTITPTPTTDENVNLLSVLFEKDAPLTPKQTLTATHWIRQILGVVIGIVFGMLRLTGFPSIVTFCFISFSAPFSFITSLHNVDLEEVTAVGTLQTEGFFPSLALFFLSWIISYTIFLPAST